MPAGAGVMDVAVKPDVAEERVHAAGADADRSHHVASIAHNLQIDGLKRLFAVEPERDAPVHERQFDVVAHARSQSDGRGGPEEPLRVKPPLVARARRSWPNEPDASAQAQLAYRQLDYQVVVPVGNAKSNAAIATQHVHIALQQEIVDRLQDLAGSRSVIAIFVAQR